MKAMILAAGLGTRLRPLTDSRPKALVEVAGRTLLEITLARLRAFGINEVIINVHHFADMVVDYLRAHNNFGMRIEISREEDLLLDTGGGLKKAAWFFREDFRQATVSQAQESKTRSVIQGEARDRRKMLSQSNRDQTSNPLANPEHPFLLHNVDVISNIDFHRMLQFHNQNRALATLAVQSRKSSRLLLFNDQLQLVGRAARSKRVDNTAAQVKASTAERKPSLTVIPSEARDPGRTAQAKSDAIPLPAPGANSSVSTRHSPLDLAFSGVHIISPRLLAMLTEEGAFSIIDVYLRLAAQGQKILAFRADEYYWRDLGRPADLSQAALDFAQPPQ